MNWLENWLLRRLCKRLVIQGYNHKLYITNYYRVINEEARKQFNEDNVPTLDYFLTECHSNALKDEAADHYARITCV